MMEPSEAVLNTVDQVQTALRAQALGFPETCEEFPWGESAFKVKGKVFVFMHRQDQELTFSVKLPVSRDMAAALPFTEPTGYGLGKHGWVTVHIRTGSEAPLEMLADWIDESYRAVAPKRLVTQLDEGGRG